jgi:hypothetical protein
MFGSVNPCRVDDERPGVKIYEMFPRANTPVGDVMIVTPVILTLTHEGLRHSNPVSQAGGESRLPVIFQQ